MRLILNNSKHIYQYTITLITPLFEAPNGSQMSLVLKPPSPTTVYHFSVYGVIRRLRVPTYFCGYSSVSEARKMFVYVNGGTSAIGDA